ncbi:hypothetical protein HAX54_039078 [Datura stramonium]|uniref:Uncharacterized protein n=1 Tax=Datura stramonium TaxID=4076 RepID=A0ABS8VKN9_DATST|nr:hypothetical protein [Datura stramonium]
MFDKLLSSNGRNPDRNANRITPQDHESAFSPSYPFLYATSGAESWGTASCMKEAVLQLFRQGGEPEIGDLEVVILVEENVLRFNVAVSDAILMAKMEGGD